MSGEATVDYDALAQQHGGAGQPDYDALAAQQTATESAPTSPTDAFSKTTGISARPPENWFQQKWNEIKSGVMASAPGGGLPQQPTALGNAAQFTGMMGQEALNLGLGPGMAEGAGAVAAAIPSAERAGKAFQELSGALGNHTVAMTDRLADTMNEIKEAADTGSTLPSVVNKFATRISDLDKGPLTYKEARQFYSNVSDLSASERMAAKAKDLRLIQLFKHALGDTIAQTAESADRLQQYQGAMSEFSKAKRLESMIEAGKTVAKKTAITAALGGAGYAGYRTIGSAMGH